jgi:hypothetical protein
MKCPMKKNINLTEKQIQNFCNKGCSVDCERFLDEYMKKIKITKDRTR